MPFNTLSNMNLLSGSACQICAVGGWRAFMCIFELFHGTFHEMFHETFYWSPWKFHYRPSMDFHELPWNSMGRLSNSMGFHGRSWHFSRAFVNSSWMLMVFLSWNFPWLKLFTACRQTIHENISWNNFMYIHDMHSSAHERSRNVSQNVVNGHPSMKCFMSVLSWSLHEVFHGDPWNAMESHRIPEDCFMNVDERSRMPTKCPRNDSSTLLPVIYIIVLCHGIFHGSSIPWTCMERSIYFYDYGSSWNSMEVHGCPWKSKEAGKCVMEIHGSWKSMEEVVDGSPSNIPQTDVRVIFSWSRNGVRQIKSVGIPVYSHECSWIFMKHFHGIRWTSMDFYEHAMEVHGIRWKFMECFMSVRSLDFHETLHRLPWKFSWALAHGSPWNMP